MGWEDDIKNCPRITYGRTVSYFVEILTRDGKVTGKVKSSEAYTVMKSVRFCLRMVPSVPQSRHGAESEHVSITSYNLGTCINIPRT